MKNNILWLFGGILVFGCCRLHAQTNVFPSSGNVGVGTSSPNYKLDVNGEAYFGGALRVGELYFSGAQSIGLAIGTERWVKLATIPNNHYVRFQLRSGSANSEEIAEIKIFGTYHNDRTAISIERQTYNEHLREVRVVGENGDPRTVYVKIRATTYAPGIVWRAIESKGAVTIHNVEETPPSGLSHFVAGDLVTTTNTNLVTTGSVGIGTSAPTAKLDLAGSMVVSGGLTNASARPAVAAGTLSFGEIRGISSVGAGMDDGFLRLSAGGGTTAGVKSFIDISGYSASVPSMDNTIVFGTYGNERMRITNAGKIGVGTDTPTRLLSLYHQYPELVLKSSALSGGVGDSTIYFGNSASDSVGWLNYSHGDNSMAFRVNSAERLRITSGGNVGIGTTSPSHKLAVNGTVRAKEVIVDTGWSDYVFASDYQLAPLSEVEAHIYEKKHLPGIPSAAEVEANGVSLGEMQSKLLAKIEELTLHLIAQEKAMAVMKNENARLSARLEHIERR